MSQITSWSELFQKEKEKEYFKNLNQILKKEYSSHICYPQKENIFKAFQCTPLNKVKVVILGQDPYHEPNQAQGLSFSVPTGIKVPPSLINIYKEIEDCTQYQMNMEDGNLYPWTQQGILLLNTILTVREHQAYSHQNIGWEIFTDECIKLLNAQDRPIVFLLWGNPARNKKVLLDNSKHLILESAHPSPLSAYRGFFGCKCFQKCNDFLVKNRMEEIHWSQRVMMQNTR